MSTHPTALAPGSGIASSHVMPSGSRSRASSTASQRYHPDYQDPQQIPPAPNTHHPQQQQYMPPVQTQEYAQQGFNAAPVMPAQRPMDNYATAPAPPPQQLYQPPQQGPPYPLSPNDAYNTYDRRASYEQRPPNTRRDSRASRYSHDSRRSYDSNMSKKSNHSHHRHHHHHHHDEDYDYDGYDHGRRSSTGHQGGQKYYKSGQKHTGDGRKKSSSVERPTIGDTFYGMLSTVKRAIVEPRDKY